MSAPSSRVGPAPESGRPFSEMKTRGVLWLLNRVAFHPRGFALCFHYPDGVARERIESGEIPPTGWSIIGNGKEVFTFGLDPEEDDLFDAVEVLLDEARERNG